MQGTCVPRTPSILEYYEKNTMNPCTHFAICSSIAKGLCCRSSKETIHSNIALHLYHNIDTSCTSYQNGRSLGTLVLTSSFTCCLSDNEASILINNFLRSSSLISSIEDGLFSSTASYSTLSAIL